MDGRYLGVFTRNEVLEGVADGVYGGEKGFFCKDVVRLVSEFLDREIGEGEILEYGFGM